MGQFLYYLIPFALVIVAAILLLGLLNMMRGGSPWRSQKLMQMRVAAQAVALVVIFAALYFMGR